MKQTQTFWYRSIKQNKAFFTGPLSKTVKVVKKMFSYHFNMHLFRAKTFLCRPSSRTQTFRNHQFQPFLSGVYAGVIWFEHLAWSIDVHCTSSNVCGCSLPLRASFDAGPSETCCQTLKLPKLQSCWQNMAKRWLPSFFERGESSPLERKPLKPQLG